MLRGRELSSLRRSWEEEEERDVNQVGFWDGETEGSSLRESIGRAVLGRGAEPPSLVPGSATTSFSLHTLIPPSPRSPPLFSLNHHHVPRNAPRCVPAAYADASRPASRRRRRPQRPARPRNWLRSEYRSPLVRPQEHVPTSHRAHSHSGSTRRTLPGSPSSRSTTPSSTQIRLRTS